MIFEKFPKVSVSVGSFEPKFEVLKQNEKTVKIKEKRKKKKRKEKKEDKKRKKKKEKRKVNYKVK